MLSKTFHFIRRNKNAALNLVYFLIFSALVALFFHQSGLFSFFNEQWIDKNIRDQGTSGYFVLGVFIAFGSSCGLPRQMSAFLAGYALGIIPGTLLATFTAAVGCAITFYVARYLAQPIINRRYPDKITIINRFLLTKTFQKTVIIRLIPAGNNFLLNLAAGVGNINAFKFISASYLGFFPQMIIFATAGSGLKLMSYWQISSSALLSIIASLLSYRLYKQYQQEFKQA